VSFIELDATRIEYEWLRSPGAATPTVVFLHEGLGSLAMWKGYPQRLQQATQASILVYSRTGCGRSTPLTEPRSIQYLEHEALDVLPALLDRLQIEDTVLFGHSDGASIGLIYASAHGHRCRGLVLLAPHVFVEEKTIESILAAKRAYTRGRLRDRLTRYHEDVDGAFRGWSEVWLDPGFRNWNIESRLPHITCPVLAIQGDQDPYGSFVHLDRIVAAAPQTQVLKLPKCGHAPHWDQPRTVLDVTADFVKRRLSSCDLPERT